jgi:CMP-N,N'-diacetyllegionaminic acid synthase
MTVSEGIPLSVLAVIPARSGSKGLPGKNIKDLGGLPLIGYAARAAGQVSQISDFVLSTEDDVIAAVGRRLGISVPFLRPHELATDQASSFDVVLHALETMERLRGQVYDAVLLLQPTCPFTQPAHIDAAIQLMQTGLWDFVGSVMEVIDDHPAYMLCGEPGATFRRAFPELPETGRRQDLPKMYVRSGNIYLTSRSLLVRHRTLIGGRSTYIRVEREEAININDAYDWMVAESRVMAECRGRQ